MEHQKAGSQYITGTKADNVSKSCEYSELIQTRKAFPHPGTHPEEVQDRKAGSDMMADRVVRSPMTIMGSQYDQVAWQEFCPTLNKRISWDKAESHINPLARDVQKPPNERHLGPKRELPGNK